MADRLDTPEAGGPETHLTPAVILGNETEEVLLAGAAAFPEFRSLGELTVEKLREISGRAGLDFATALLYDRVQHSQPHADFIKFIDQQRGEGVSARRNCIVGVVPAAFFKEAPNSGADGRLILEEARQLGLSVQQIPVASTGRLEKNAEIILEWLAKNKQSEIILASLCKGGADVKIATGLPGAAELFRPVSAWINICGTLNGSPVAEWLLASGPRQFLAWAYCKCRGASLDFLSELKSSPGNSIIRPLVLPGSMRLINVVGFPLRRHLTNRFMRMCYDGVSRGGPTDGGVLLGDVCRLPGLIYPVWGGDHYLRPEPRARRIISSVLEYIIGDDNQTTPVPIDEIPASDRTGQRFSGSPRANSTGH